MEGHACHNNLGVRLNCDAIGLIRISEEVRIGEPAPPKGRIEVTLRLRALARGGASRILIGSRGWAGKRCRRGDKAMGREQDQREKRTCASDEQTYRHDLGLLYRSIQMRRFDSLGDRGLKQESAVACSAIDGSCQHSTPASQAE